MRFRMPHSREQRSTDPARPSSTADPAAKADATPAGSATPTGSTTATSTTPSTTATADAPSAWAVPRGVRTASDWSWRTLVIVAGVAAICALLAYFSSVTVPIAIAVLLAALLYPITRALGKAMPRALASGLTVLGTVALTLGLLGFVGTQFTSQFDDISSQVGDGIEEVRVWIRSTFGLSDSQFDQWIQRGTEQLSSSGSNLGESVAQAGTTASHFVAGIFIALFALFFFLYDGQRIWAWVVRLFPRTAREQVHTSGIIAWKQLSAFTHATILVAAVDAIGISAVAAVLGVPFASGIAILVFFGAFVPVIGATISGAVAVLLALVALGPVQALIMLGGVIVVQQLESHILQPFLLGRAVRVHPLAVILAIAAGVVSAGIVGALMAVPLIAVLNAVGGYLLGGNVTPDEPDDADQLLTPAERQRTEDAADEAEQAVQT